MGCDMHIHSEAKVKATGKWEHYGDLNVGRNYLLFAIMAGVRNYPPAVEPIDEPRGLPDDVSLITELENDAWGDDAHSHSWLSHGEVREVVRRMMRTRRPTMSKHPLVRELTSTPEEFEAALKRASEQIAKWPKWKRETPTTSIPKHQR